MATLLLALGSTLAAQHVGGPRPRSIIAIGDVDGDSDLDLVVGCWPGQTHLFLDDGTGTLIDVTATHMPVDGDLTSSVVLCDVDGDTDLDLVLGNWRQQNRLYLNDGGGHFTDVTAAQMPADADRTHVVACADIDMDGDVDLLIGNWAQPNRVYLNDGTGRFVSQ